MELLVMVVEVVPLMVETLVLVEEEPEVHDELEEEVEEVEEVAEEEAEEEGVPLFVVVPLEFVDGCWNE